MDIETLADAERYLEGLINLERSADWPYSRMGLGPIRALLDRLGHPEQGTRILHIAGSKGKGSTALAAEALLGAAGQRVGTFSSPHLESFVERFRVDGTPVPGERLAEAVAVLRPHVDALRAERPHDAPTFFDALCAAGLWLFAEAGVDWIVLEVGLGGRLDSTNAVSPTLCCITSIELEHTDVLGDTTAKIAAEKAGIVKPGVPLVLGPVPPDARAVILGVAAAAAAPVTELGVDYQLDEVTSDVSGVRGTLRDEGGALAFALPVLGAHNARNAALALVAVGRALGVDPLSLGEASREAFARFALPGRAELVSRDPALLVDAAHTAASARALAAVIEELAPRAGVHYVLSVSAGKDLDAILEALLPRASRLTLTRALKARSLAPTELAAVIRRVRPELALRVVPNPHLALGAARAGQRAGELVCATGSFYLAGIARRVWGGAPA